MATGQSHGFLRQLNGLLAEGTAAGLTDGQLLERFSARGGPAAELAFAAIVERHGPMVLRVCRGVLGRSREADAEDAFQATFLVLVKRARSLWVADSLGPWLHQVALRTASCARGAAARRYRHEAAGARPAEATVIHADDEDRDELGRILHEEIGRLPDRYRIPVVLCDLEGQTHEQAARHAGWPVGTVKSRLTRARERLRGRLARRGLSPTAAVIPAIRLDLEAQVPDALIRSTTAAALRLAAGQTLAGTSTGLLAQGVLTIMARSSWWKAGTVLLAAAATVSGAGLAAGQAPAAPKAPPAADQPPLKKTIEPQLPPKARPLPPPDVPTVVAESGPFRITVSASGVLERARNQQVNSRVQGARNLISWLPNGTRVKKGDLVVELDSSLLRDQLASQKLATLTAEAAQVSTRQAVSLAERALKGYEEETYPSNKEEITREIGLAKSEVQKAQTRIDRTTKARDEARAIQARKDHSHTVEEITASIDLEDRIDQAERDSARAKVALEAAERKLAALGQSRARYIQELRGEIAKAQAVDRIKDEASKLEKDKQSWLEEQIRACKLTAPIDGIVMLRPGIELGRIAERQPLFTVYDEQSPLQIAGTVGYPRIKRIKPGQKVIITPGRLPEDRLTEEHYTGVVTEIPRGDMTRISNHAGSSSNFLVRLDDTGASPLPTQSAKLEIVIAEHSNVLTIPDDAVLYGKEGTRDYVAVKLPSGEIDWREVTLGEGADRRVIVQSGLRPSEQVVTDPEQLLTTKEKLERGLPIVAPRVVVPK